MTNEITRVIVQDEITTIDIQQSKLSIEVSAPGTPGPTGATGPKGDKGDTGPQGLNINLKASVATPALLPMSGNSINDARVVDSDGDLYTWDGSSWSSAGQIVGPQGPKGDKGDTGLTGPKGDKGDTGDTGLQGPKGDTGDTGAQGPKGDTGDTGPQGEQGIPGPEGPKGDTGDTGPQSTFSIASETPPLNPVEGQAWFNSLNGKSYIYYDSYWVEIGSSLSGPAGTSDYTLLTNTPDLSIYATEDYVDTVVGNVTVDLSTAAGENIDWNSSTSQFDAVIPVATPNTLGTVYGKTSIYSASANTSLGSDSLVSRTTGNLNTAVGAQAANYTTSGSENVAVGRTALYTNTTGSYNIAIGSSSLPENTSGEYNVAIGQGSGVNIISGSNNILLGFGAMASGNVSNEITLGNSSITRFRVPGLGINWDSTNVPGAEATPTTLGTVYGKTFEPTSGKQSAAIGYEALGNLTTGTNNTAFGYRAGKDITSGFSNTAIGMIALNRTNTGQFNVAIGQNTLGENTDGAGNTAIGTSALWYLYSGNNNTALGINAGWAQANGSELLSGSNNLILGANAVSSSQDVSNEITLGNSSINRFRIPGLGIDWTSSNVPSAASWNYIGSVSSTSGSSVAFSSLNGQYKELFMTFSAVSQSGKDYPIFRINADSNSSNYEMMATRTNGGTTYNLHPIFTGAFPTLDIAFYNSNGSLHIKNANSTGYKGTSLSYNGMISSYITGTYIYDLNGIYAGGYLGSSAVSSINISLSGGSFSSGYWKLWGLK